MSKLILVNEQGEKIGTCELLPAHTGKGKLHKAFSVYVFRNHRKEILLQRRSKKKMLWPEILANTCCSHLKEGEILREAAEKRLRDEMGFTCPLKEAASYIYRAEDPNGKGVEHEHVTTFIGDADDAKVVPNPDEVEEYKWMSVKDVLRDMKKNPDEYAPWFKIGLPKILAEQSLHLAIIPDGNRRWARSRGLPSWKGHQKAVDNLKGIVEWLRDNSSVKVLTVWCFSTENWKRSKEDVGALMKILERYLRNERKNLIKNDVRFVHSGRRDRIPRTLAALMAETERMTKDCKKFTLHLALDYGGKDEIVRAVNQLINAGFWFLGSEAHELQFTRLTRSTSPVKKMRDSAITEDSIRAHLDHPELPDIDVIFRTSGEMRSSNFFFWQAAYAEWVFTDKHFPDVMPKDIADCISEYQKRQRRYGV